MFAIDPEGVETRVIHDLVDFRGKDVLELGAGDGRLTWRYADLSASVLALEPKELLVEQAGQATPARLHGRVRFRIADATTADLPTGRSTWWCSRVRCDEWCPRASSTP